MGPAQFADIFTAIQLLHKSMKNVIEIVFAISPFWLYQLTVGLRKLATAPISSELVVFIYFSFDS